MIRLVSARDFFVARTAAACPSSEAYHPIFLSFSLVASLELGSRWLLLSFSSFPLHFGTYYSIIRIFFVLSQNDREMIKRRKKGCMGDPSFTSLLYRNSLGIAHGIIRREYEISLLFCGQYYSLYFLLLPVATKYNRNFSCNRLIIFLSSIFYSYFIGFGFLFFHLSITNKIRIKNRKLWWGKGIIYIAILLADNFSFLFLFSHSDPL